MLKLLRPYMAMRFTLVGAALIAINPLCLSSMHARQSGRAIAIKNVRIFDGSTVIPTGAVIIEGGKIKSVGKTVAPPDGAEIIDGTGHTLLPGLIDSHTHAYGPALRQAVMFGVTTELDMFSDHRTAAQMRKEQSEGKAAGRADLFSAGTLVTAPGGHGTEYGMKIPTITAPGEAQAFVDARIDELLITGEISPDLPYAWAGAMFSPGATMMAPANLSSKKEISFWAKGDGKDCRLMLFARSLGFQPAVKSFVVGAEWKRFTFRISEFGGMDGSDLMGILFAGGPAPGRFVLQIDDVILSQ
jgi:hypothetical protein